MNNSVKQSWSEKVQESALRSAKELFGQSALPTDLRELKVKSTRQKAVLSWKMEMPGRPSFELIAKRNEIDGARIEHLLYTTILPRLGLGSLRCFGVVEEDNKDFAWIFIEHAGHSRFSPDIREHNNLAMQYLSVLHGNQLEPELWNFFPKRDDEHYAVSLQAARSLIEYGITNPFLSSPQRDVVARTLRLLDGLESRWSVVQEMCSPVPRCLIHGDFLGKNIRIEPNGSGYRLKIFDWDAACLGFPFLDIAESLLPEAIGQATEVGTNAYLSGSRRWWPGIEEQSLRRLIGLGAVFWSVDCIRGHAEGLHYEWVDKIIENMRVYSSVLKDGLTLAEL